MTLPEINYNLCVGCEACVDICDNEIFESYIFDNNVVVKVNADGFCEQCHVCQLYCDEGAIDFPDRFSGVIL